MDDYYNNASSPDNDDSDNSNEFARVNRVMLSKSSDEYRQRRERNNAAVKKSRFKSKQKTLETQKRVNQLKDENSQLERRVETLTRELNFMRNIFVPRRDSQQHHSHLKQHEQQAHPNPIPTLQSPMFVIHQDENNLKRQQKNVTNPAMVRK